MSTAVKVDPQTQLERLRHVADLLAALGWETEGTQFAVFAREGFTKHPKGIHALDLAALYGR